MRDSSKSGESRSESGGGLLDDDVRRSRSLDGETTLGSAFSRQLDKVCTHSSVPMNTHTHDYSYLPTQQQHSGKKQTPWRKVKDIIQTHRGSLRSKSRSRSAKSTSGSVGCSRDVSPCDSVGGYVFVPAPAPSDVRRNIDQNAGSYTDPNIY